MNYLASPTKELLNEVRKAKLISGLCFVGWMWGYILIIWGGFLIHRGVGYMCLGVFVCFFSVSLLKVYTQYVGSSQFLAKLAGLVIRDEKLHDRSLN